MKPLFFVLVLLFATLPMGLSAQREQWHILYAPAPEVPAVAKQFHLEGTGLYAMHVLPSGKVASVEVVKSAGHSVLDRAAIETLQTWRFAPSQSVQKVTTPVVFSLSPNRH